MVLLVFSVEIEAQSQSNQSPTQLSPEIAPFHARVGNELTLFSSASRLAINSRPKDGATDGVVPVRLGYSRVLVSSLPRRSLTHSLLSINSSGKKAIFHFIGSRRTLHGSLGEEDFIIIRSRVFDSKLSARSREKLKLFFLRLSRPFGHCFLFIIKTVEKALDGFPKRRLQSMRKVNKFVRERRVDLKIVSRAPRPP